MKKVSIQYLAGFVDGEGAIMIAATGPGKSKAARNFHLKLSIGNTHQGVLAAIQRQFVGGLTKSDLMRGFMKDAYRLDWYGAKAAVVINDIYPFLIIKRRQAELALEFNNYRKATGGHGGAGTKRPGEQIAEMAQYRLQMKKLNFRGRKQSVMFTGIS